jgi:hypothetical protein
MRSFVVFIHQSEDGLLAVNTFNIAIVFRLDLSKIAQFIDKIVHFIDNIDKAEIELI